MSSMGRRCCFRQLATRTGAISSHVCGGLSRNEPFQDYAGHSVALYLHNWNIFSQTRKTVQATQISFSSNSSQMQIVDKNNSFQANYTVMALPSVIKDLDR